MFTSGRRLLAVENLSVDYGGPPALPPLPPRRGHGRLRGTLAPRRADIPPAGPRPRPRPGAPPPLPVHDRAREPPARQLSTRRPRAPRPGARAGLRDVPRAARPAPAARPHPAGRRAADGRQRARPHEHPALPDARRALPRPVAAPRRRGGGDDSAPQRGRHDGALHRAGYPPVAHHLTSRLHPRVRPPRPERHERGAARERAPATRVHGAGLGGAVSSAAIRSESAALSETRVRLLMATSVATT